MATSHHTNRVKLLNAHAHDFLRFIQKIEVSTTQFHEGTPCWIWKAYIHPLTGYGQFRYNGKLSSPHRFSHEYFIGLIPEGEEIDHKCHVRACASPLHVQTLTHKDNASRRLKCYVNSGQCKNGHKMEGDNVSVNKRTGKIKCKTCNREQVKAFYAKNPGYNEKRYGKHQRQDRQNVNFASDDQPQ